MSEKLRTNTYYYPDSEEYRKIIEEYNIQYPYEKRLEYKIFRTWQRMIHKCYRSGINTTCYKTYRSKGIEVCQDWRYNYDNFHKWSIEHGCDLNLCIDRIDVTGNYTPMNCQWITINKNTGRMKYDYFYRGGCVE